MNCFEIKSIEKSHLISIDDTAPMAPKAQKVQKAPKAPKAQKVQEAPKVQKTQDGAHKLLNNLPNNEEVTDGKYIQV